MRLSSFLLISGTCLLSACATVLDGPTQDVTILTPGASEAHCIVDNGLRYKFVGGETQAINRSYKPLTIDCYGSGNRHIRKVIGSDVNDTAAVNVSNAIVPGVAYDALGGGLYTYPDVITIDFVGTPTNGFELPDYHNKDLPNPYMQSTEDMGPGTPLLSGEGKRTSDGIERIENRATSNPFAGLGKDAPADSASVSEPAAAAPTPIMPAPAIVAPPAASTSGMTADELTRSMNPSVFGPK